MYPDKVKGKNKNEKEIRISNANKNNFLDHAHYPGLYFDSFVLDFSL